MLRPSIKRRIVGIATGMIILAVITSVMSMALASRVGHLLDELTNRYIPAYADLARMDLRSLERALMLRRMIIAKMQTPPDEASAAADLKAFEEKGLEVQQEAEAARKLINAIIDDPSTPSDNVALTRIDERIDTADLRHRLNEEIGQLLRQLEGRNLPARPLGAMFIRFSLCSTVNLQRMCQSGASPGACDRTAEATAKAFYVIDLTPNFAAAR
jgi:hypothetical protein